MALINLRGVELGFGHPLLLDRIDLQVEPGERICLVGRNGAGKSTLMKLIAGEINPDGGAVTRTPGIKTAMLSQEVPGSLAGTVFEVVTTGLGGVSALVAEYHAALKALSDGEESALMRLEQAQHKLESEGGWQAGQRAETVISMLKLPAESSFGGLSGGLKRRVLLARALVAEPDLLLLDEPTNHLDIDSIGWLEEFLKAYKGTILFVTHDRMLLQKLATRIIELDRGNLTSWDCDYRTYLERKQALLDSEARQNALFDKLLSKEEAWIRQGIKARRTRNEGRVRELQAMRKERSERRELEGGARMRVQKGALSGRLVIEATNISYSYGADEPDVIKDFSTVIMRGDHVGIIGPNGSGKTTLLKLLLSELEPTTGSVRLGTRLEVSYFDQHRRIIDEDKTVQENIGEGNDQIIIDGQARHVIGYLQDFLFSPERARTPARVLSGGERARLLLAKLFSRPSNVLVMDEPTNDLDAETLDLLEELLLEYTGTVLLVSHDRAFLNNVVTSTIVFENGGLNEYVGGYDDWLRQRPAAAEEKTSKKPGKERHKKATPTKLSFKEERELNELPGIIETLEAEQRALYETMSDPNFYKTGTDKATVAKSRVHEIELEIAESYSRWERLEALKAEYEAASRPGAS